MEMLSEVARPTMKAATPRQEKETFLDSREAIEGSMLGGLGGFRF